MEEFAIDAVAEEAQSGDESLAADYNIAPTKKVYVVAQRPASPESAVGSRVLAVASWGLVPSWAKDPSIGSRLINARLETAAQKPSFRSAFAKRRCLIPADGFYEWYEPAAPDAEQGRKPLKQPYFIHPADGGSLALAGLFEFWRPRHGAEAEPWLMSVTILTTTSTDAIGRIHDRMPLPLPPGSWAAWLDPQTAAADLDGVLASHTARRLQAHPVSRMVNNVRNNGAELMAPLTAEA